MSIGLMHVSLPDKLEQNAKTTIQEFFDADPNAAAQQYRRKMRILKQVLEDLEWYINKVCANQVSPTTTLTQPPGSSMANSRPDGGAGPPSAGLEADGSDRSGTSSATQKRSRKCSLRDEGDV